MVTRTDQAHGLDYPTTDPTGVQPIRSIPIGSQAKMMDFGPGTSGRQKDRKGVGMVRQAPCSGNIHGFGGRWLGRQGCFGNIIINADSKAAVPEHLLLTGPWALPGAQHRPWPLATCHHQIARFTGPRDHRTGALPGQQLSAKIAAVTAIFGSNGAIFGDVISSIQRALHL